VIAARARAALSGSTIKVSAKRNGHNVVLSVDDHGAGITTDEQAQLGERFFRGPRLAASASGSGLGLWIAKAFVGANGGRIHAVSPGANQGSTVSILLPFAPEGNQPETAPDE